MTACRLWWAQAILIFYCRWFLFSFSLAANLRRRSVDRQRILRHIRRFSEFIKLAQKFERPQKKMAAQKHQNFGECRTFSQFDWEYFRNETWYYRNENNVHLAHTHASCQVDERWSTNGEQRTGVLSHSIHSRCGGQAWSRIFPKKTRYRQTENDIVNCNLKAGVRN